MSVWRFNVLNSEQEEAFCEREREHTLKYYYDKKVKKNSECELGEDLKGVQYLDDDDDEKVKQSDDKEVHAKELSRQR